MMNSKKQSSLLLILSITAFILSSSVFGRAPAVEPVTGISIDQYQEVDPKKDPGFNWNQDKSKHIRLKNEGQRTPAAYDSKSSIAMTVIFILGIVSFPIALWFTLMKSFPEAPTNQELPTSQGTTIDLAAERSRRKEQSEDSMETDDDVHKAS